VPDVKVGETLDQYRVVAQIARGGMAAIFKAVDRATGATVAVKVPYLRYESDPAFHARFRREEEIGRRLNHPNIIRVLKPRQQSRMYIVTEYVNGVPLRALLAPGQPLPTDKALDIARQLAAAVVYLHGQHVVHRDLKPENILVTPEGQVKILDFGIALDHPGRRVTWLGSTAMGTPAYMAPEQVKGLRGDERSDIYALGVLLYEMLTGARPFPGDTPEQVMQSKLGSDPLPPSQFRPDLHAILEEIILHAIERLPGKRYATAAELLADLQDPTRVRPLGRVEQLRPRSVKEVRLRRMLVRTVIVVLVVVGLGLLVWLANRYPATPYQPGRPLPTPPVPATPARPGPQARSPSGGPNARSPLVPERGGTLRRAV
jgi:serine/threonine protein kinase